MLQAKVQGTFAGLTPVSRPKIICSNHIIYPLKLSDHPEVWSAFFEDCNGKSQSPIDIQPKKAKTKAFDSFEFSATYFGDLKGDLFNNGHTCKTQAINEDICDIQ